MALTERSNGKDGSHSENTKEQTEGIITRQVKTEREINMLVCSGMSTLQYL